MQTAQPLVSEHIESTHGSCSGPAWPWAEGTVWFWVWCGGSRTAWPPPLPASSSVCSQLVPLPGLPRVTAL